MRLFAGWVWGRLKVSSGPSVHCGGCVHSQVGGGTLCEVLVWEELCPPAGRATETLPHNCDRGNGKVFHDIASQRVTWPHTHTHTHTHRAQLFSHSNACCVPYGTRGNGKTQIIKWNKWHQPTSFNILSVGGQTERTMRVLTGGVIRTHNWVCLFSIRSDTPHSQWPLCTTTGPSAQHILFCCHH